MSEKLGQMILVGFGSFNLDTMLEWRDTDKEPDLVFAPDKWPPRFKPETSCSQKELETFLEYVAWATKLLENIPKENK
jgi:hypothetical protein